MPASKICAPSRWTAPWGKRSTSLAFGHRRRFANAPASMHLREPSAAPARPTLTPRAVAHASLATTAIHEPTFARRNVRFLEIAPTPFTPTTWWAMRSRVAIARASTNSSGPSAINAHPTLIRQPVLSASPITLDFRIASRDASTLKTAAITPSTSTARSAWAARANAATSGMARNAARAQSGSILSPIAVAAPSAMTAIPTAA